MSTHCLNALEVKFFLDEIPGTRRSVKQKFPFFWMVPSNPTALKKLRKIHKVTDLSHLVPQQRYPTPAVGLSSSSVLIGSAS